MAYPFVKRARVAVPAPFLGREQYEQSLFVPFTGTREMTYDEHCEHESKLHMEAQLRGILKKAPTND